MQDTFYVHSINIQARERDMLPMWTVYDHPRDYPHVFVARCHVSNGDGKAPTENLITDPSLNSLRKVLRNAGLTCLCRDESDDPKIIETWL